MKQLEGGFINRVYLEDGIVTKIFTNDNLVGMSSIERAQVETNALLLFGGIVAPRLLSCNGLVLCQEFIEGEAYEVRARRGEQVFQAAGALLAEIHSFAPIDINRIFQADYDARFERAMKIADPILRSEKLLPKFRPSWDIVYEWGSRYIHGDFWLGNIIGEENKKPKAIDWEFSGVRSPYEDFAIVDLWIFREFPNSENYFWEGYGKNPDKETINAFLVLRCVEFLATTNIDAYLLENKDGFYHNKIAVLKTLLRV